MTVGLPAVILGYLAFRGIRNDRARAEQEVLEQHQKAAHTIVDLVENEIRLIEAFIEGVYRRKNLLTDSDFRSVAEQLKYLSPLVSDPFIVQGKEVVYPLVTKVYVGERASPLFDRSGDLSERIEQVLQAEHLEFQLEQYGRAARAYEEALPRANEDWLRSEILFGLARNHRRLGKEQEAKSTYERIVRDYKGTDVAGGMPAELAARLELAKLARSLDVAQQTADVVLQLYGDISRGKWNLTRAQYRFVASEVTQIWTELLSEFPSSLKEHKMKFQALEQGAESRIAHTEKLLLFEMDVLPSIRESFRANPDAKPPNSRFAVTSGSHSFSLIALQAPANRPDAIEVFGTLVGRDGEVSPLSSLLAKVILPRNVLFQVTNEHGDPVDGSSIPETARKTVEAKFTGDFPRIYIFAIILVLGVLAFGTFLTVRMITREVELAKLRSDFVSTVSHELRSPLTSIRQLSEMLQGGRTRSEERRQRYYDTIVEQSEQLSLLVENILDFARMDERRKQFRFEEVDVPQLLRELVERVRHQVRHKGFTIHLEVAKEPPPVKLDPDAMAQAFINLMDNAIKYSGTSREIEISVYEDSGHLKIDVKDHGIGIRKEEIEKVFDRFYRGTRDGKRPTRGTGLGLTLVKQIVEGHHGTVQVESGPGRGSTFSVKLPLELRKDTSSGTNSYH